MNILVNIAISAIIAALGAVGVYRHAPMSWFDTGVSQNLGATITTINGTDTLSSSRSTINTNFTNLNTSKLENSDYYGTTTHATISSLPALTTASALVTVGTLTSGSLGSGFTTVAVARGGTGSTTLSSNQVLLGNGTGNIGIVSGYGTSGQFLTSNGAATAPTWTTGSVDQTLDYNWTGASRVKNLHASSTSANPIVLNGISLNTPSTQGAASTTLTNDGSGNLTWIRPEYTLIASTTLSTASASTTLSWTAPAGATDLKIVIAIPSLSANVTRTIINFNSDTGANYGYGAVLNGTLESAASGASAVSLFGEGGATTAGRYFTINVNNMTGLAKTMSFVGAVIGSGAHGSGTWTNTSARINAITVGSGTANTMAIGTRISVYASNQ